MRARALPRWAFVVALLALTPPLCRGAVASAAQYALYANLQGEVLLDNSRVHVEKFIVQPGQSTGRRAPSGGQLQVFIKGGVLTSVAGRSTLWRDGRVAWHDASEAADAGSNRNSGSLDALRSSSGEFATTNLA